ncbi:MAG: PspC domain-containing protein [Bacteroidetes bacterium]|nr:MAG: PspC domain-containing protein [Bacteroidota bacterium]
MKKTVSVNIRGLHFIIEEDAYELLQNYLDRLTHSLKNEPGSREIIEDIELRIAELSMEKLSANKTVIELNDIEEIISIMGDPSQYIDESDNLESEGRTHSNQSAQDNSEKRLFRDTDNAVIAGVCAGIANFLKIDVVIIRAIFVIMFLFAGFGVPLYLILWVIVPKTRSTIDRLRMKGKPITVETVREEVENAAENLSKGSKRFAQQVRNDDSYGRTVRNGLNVLVSILGAIIILFGLSLLVPFLIFILGGFEFIPVANDSGFLSFSEFGEFVLANSSDYNMMASGVLLVSFSVIIFLLLSGSMLIFKIRNKWAKISLFLLFLTGVAGAILSGTAGVRTGKDFTQYAEVEVPIAAIATSELKLFPSEKVIGAENDKRITSNPSFSMIEIENDEVRLYGIQIHYKPSTDSLFHIRKEFSARGRSHDKGLERCQNIDHNTNVEGDSVWIDTYYSFPKEDKLRDQEVSITIEIPKNGVVRIKDRMITLDGIDENRDEDEPSDQSGYIKANGRYKHHN